MGLRTSRSRASKVCALRWERYSRDGCRFLRPQTPRSSQLLQPGTASRELGLARAGFPRQPQSRSPRLPSDEARAKTRSLDFWSRTTERGWREIAAGQERRGATLPFVLALAFPRASGKRHSHSPRPQCGHQLRPGRIPAWGFLPCFPGGETEGWAAPQCHWVKWAKPGPTLGGIPTENCAEPRASPRLETSPVSNPLCGLEVPTPLQG